MFAATSSINQAGSGYPVYDLEGIFYSVDQGRNWLQCPSTKGIDWQQIEVSTDGQTVVGVDSSASLYVSKDGCQTWELVDKYVGFAIALKPDGKSIFVTNDVVYNDKALYRVRRGLWSCGKQRVLTSLPTTRFSHPLPLCSNSATW